jgi:sigma-B regulation protein RsbU (phosphoserine phosphatase)
MNDAPATPEAAGTAGAGAGPAWVADALIGAEGSEEVLARLEEVLHAAQALPARLYLYDDDHGVFYPAAGLRCEIGSEELPAPRAGAALPRGRRILSSRGNWVGLLAVEDERAAASGLLDELCRILGPVLLAAHRRAQTVDELQQVKAEAAQLISAGHLLHHLEVEVLLVRILEMVMSAVRAQVGAVMTVDEQGALNLRVSLGLTAEHVQAIRDRSGRPLAEQVFAQGQAILLDAEAITERLDLSALGARLDGLLILPVASRDRRQGVVVLANPEGEFGEGQKRIAETVCAMAAIALDNALLVRSTLDRERLKREMDLAQEVQRQMFPEGGVMIASLRAEGDSRPCDETGGDYYSYLIRDQQLVAMIGDVSGHGLGAALYTTMAHAIIQQQLRSGSALESASLVLNEALYHTQSGRFMTFALVQVDPQAMSFSYISAGHNPLLWINRGRVRWLASCGMPLGILPTLELPPQGEGALEAGDYLILYTDGFTEAVDPGGELYGEERLADVAVLAWQHGLAPAELIARLTADIDRWSGGVAHVDDLTMVVIAVGR